MQVTELIEKEGLRRGLRQETINTYSSAVGKFFRTYGKQPREVTKKDIEHYITQLLEWKKSGSTVNVHLHALKFFYEKVLKKRLMVNIPLTKARKRLPEYLTQEEIVRFFEAVGNSKQKLIVLFTYGSGFRVSEIIRLKVKDLELEEEQGWIRDGKGGRDRFFIIPGKLKGEIEKWIKENELQPEDWLFSGRKTSGRNFHYSDSSVRKIVGQARSKAGISKHATPHTLRHSFATHLLENGYSLIEVKELLGHRRIETTMVYTHLAKPKLSNVISPYDTLKSDEE